ncbi:MAG: hypothetical protein Q4E24_14080 [bacterium]|nr:hypothetical protein [bacterium]
MGECILLKSGSGGLDPDELTATAAQILQGYLAGVQGNDEPVEGTIPVQPTGQKATAIGVNDKGLWYKINPGYYGTDEWGDLWVYRTFAEVAAVIGITAAKLAAGQTVLGIDGSFSNDANAIAANILSGKTAYVGGNKVTGTMVNRGAVTQALNAGGGYKIPAGYHDGNGEVIANALSGQTAGTAVAANILSGKTAWVNGAKVTGTMVNHAGTPQHIDAMRIQNDRFEVAVAAGYHGYSWANNSYEYIEFSELAAKLELTAAKLLKGQTVCGVVGTATGDANAVAADIASGKTAYVNGKKITGTSNMRNVGWATEDDRLRFQQSDILIRSGMGNFASFAMEHEWEYYSIIVKSLPHCQVMN